MTSYFYAKVIIISENALLFMGKIEDDSLETEGYHIAHTPLRTGRQVVIAESAHILYVEELEDIVYTQYELGIGTVGIHNV